MKKLKINGYHSNPINPYQHYSQTTKRLAQTKQSSQVKSDQVNISDEAKKLQGIKRLETERMTKVNTIKEKVENGTYSVNTDEVAKKMLSYWNSK
ncbi:flagellar biosynthesis anti-sigma factor FlgM [Terrilactibacillus laevilacticus]|uniref:flagellar biosynthesis anti-sigma factor FlgM n=1 Tax=Terrilactibacillus laevilacticus TaxID=1380157 RepID=UPI001FE2E013|nr:flagellar biosynthesis anti-sigma factor FlgM [Terrilactibacillus laevilacticus]